MYLQKYKWQPKKEYLNDDRYEQTNGAVKYEICMAVT